MRRPQTCAATASTDTGHVSKDSADSSWALGHPEIVADFGYRGLHVMTEHGKKLTTTLYETPPARSYYVGRLERPEHPGVEQHRRLRERRLDWPGRSLAPALSLPAGCRLLGIGQHRRGVEFQLPDAAMKSR